MKSKTCIVTSNVGGMDPILGMCKQTIDVDYYFYDENNLPFPLTNLNNRLKAKYCKLQTHRFLPDYDNYIYIDGRIRVAGANFAEVFIEQLGENDLAIYKHRERSNVYDEMNFIIEEMMKGSTYLLSRYGNQQLVKELLFFKENKLPKNYPLFTGGFFARKNNKVMNDCFDEWWRRTIEFSVFDQGMLSYCLWNSKAKVNELEWDPARTHKLISIEKHL